MGMKVGKRSSNLNVKTKLIGMKCTRLLLRKALQWENPQAQWRRGHYVPIKGQF